MHLWLAECHQCVSDLTVFLAEVEGLLNSLVSLVLIVQQEREEVIRKFVNKIVQAQAPEYAAIRLKV